MIAIIPAAGLGTRFLPATKVVPKEMLPIGNRPALDLIVEEARSAGASAKFAGSGGAIVGLYEDESQFRRLSAALALIGCTTIKPTIAVSDEALATVAANWRDA